MQLQDFDYQLPEELIAKFPASKRTSSRLLCLNSKTGSIAHKQFTDIKSFLRPNDLLVMNNTKVIPARLYGKKATGGKIELLIEKILDDNSAFVQLRASKSPQAGTKLYLTDENIVATVIARSKNLFKLQFTTPILPLLQQKGKIPLPPYMKREAVLEDNSRYQTVYATNSGAVAAPTAGLHFDEELLAELTQQGIKSCFITLHVGAGTYQPVRTESIEQHKMHEEYIEVSQDVVDLITATRKQGGRIIAVGTTVVRSLETACSSGSIKEFNGYSSLFIYPGYKFNIIDALITNFHFPQSTLLMLVSAFAGRENILSAYKQAVLNKYRFFSYGDAMFIN